MLTGKHTTFIVSHLLLAIVRDAITLPLEPSSEDSQGDRGDDQQGGHLTDEDSAHALDPKFVDTKKLHDEDMDPNLLEGNIEGDDEDLMSRASRKYC